VSQRFVSLVGTYQFLRVIVALPFLALGMFYLLHAAGQFLDPDRYGWWRRHHRLRWIATRYPAFLTLRLGRSSKGRRWVAASFELLLCIFYVGIGLAAMVGGK